jgi:hypothetical protein
VEPPITFFEGDIFIRHEYRRSVQLRKLTNGIVKYKLRLEGQNRLFDVNILAGGVSLNDQENGIISGEIHDDNIELEFVIRSEHCGTALAYFYIEIEDGPPISFQCQADFRGPIIETRDPVINMGLSKVNTKKHQTIELENTSPVAATFMIKSSHNTKLDFETAIMPDESIEHAHPMCRVGRPIVSSQGNQVLVDSFCKTLEPHEKFKVDVMVHCITEETLHEEIEVMVEDSDSLFLQVHAEIQKPKVYVNRNTVELGKIYAGVKEVVEYDNGKNKS